MGSEVREKESTHALFGASQGEHNYATDVIVKILGIGVKRITIYPDETQTNPIHELSIDREDLDRFEQLISQHEQGRCEAESWKTYMDPIDWDCVWKMMELYAEYMRENGKEDYIFYALQ